MRRPQLGARVRAVRRGLARSLAVLRSPSWPGLIARACVLAAVLPLLVSPGEDGRPAQTLGGGDVDVAATQQDPGDSAVGTAPNQRGDRAGATGSPTSGDVVDAHPVVASEVEPLRADLVVRPEGGLEPAAIFRVLGLEGIRHLASTAEVRAVLRNAAGEETEVDLLVVDVSSFRPLTPAVTAQTPGVWERLLDGDVVVRHDVADRNRLELGEDVALRAGDGDPRAVRIGAFASNGAPPLAEALVPWSVGRELGASGPTTLIVSVDEGHDPDEVGERVSEALDGAAVERLEAPSTERAVLEGSGSTSFEPFSYISHGDGMITIDSSWTSRWITTADVPIFDGSVRCHRVMIPQLRAALAEVQEAGLDRYIDRSQYGGCWVPRHILFNPSRALSMHAWGLAIDFNVSTNQYGADPQMHPGIVEIFERWGFEWGGYWSTPDGMHFELRSVVQR